MAKLYGESGAWKDARAPLHAVGLFPKDPAEVRHLLPTLEKDLANSEAAAEEAFDRKTEELKADSVAKQKSYEASSAQLQEEFDRQEQEITRRFSPEVSPISFLARAKQRLLAIPLRIKLNILRKRHDLRLKGLRAVPDEAQYTLRRHLEEKVLWVEAYRRPQRQKLDAANHVLGMKEYAGAVAEHEVIYHLKALTDQYHIFGDVRLQYHRTLYYENNHLRTAQIDYVVVGPQGVFLIEVKHWSREFTQSGNFHNPYLQVDRASYLCYRMLKEAGLKTKVRTIIATLSTLPQKPVTSYAKVLKPAEVYGYIRYFPPVMSAEQTAELVGFFQEYQPG